MSPATKYSVNVDIIIMSPATKYAVNVDIIIMSPATKYAVNVDIIIMSPATKYAAIPRVRKLDSKVHAMPTIIIIIHFFKIYSSITR